MKKVLFLSILLGAITVLTSCTAESPYDDFYGWGGGENGYGMGGGSASTTGELTTFDIAIDRTTVEPTAVAAEYFPDEEDILENNTFSIEIPIDLSNPEAKTLDGVEVTVNGGHVTANHGSVKNVCYVVSGTTYFGGLVTLGGPGQGDPGQGGGPGQGGPGARY